MKNLIPYLMKKGKKKTMIKSFNHLATEKNYYNKNEINFNSNKYKHLNKTLQNNTAFVNVIEIKKNNRAKTAENIVLPIKTSIQKRQVAQWFFSNLKTKNKKKLVFKILDEIKLMENNKEAVNTQRINIYKQACESLNINE